MIKPPRLRKGDTLGIVAPASPPVNPREIQRGKKTLEDMGYRVVLGRYLSRRRRYLAGTDEERAQDLNQMFADPAVQGIFCVRGGYGAGRILNFLDFEAVRKNPKVFMGYSDITALHLAILRKVELVTFYGPMVVTEMAHRFSDYTRIHMMKAIALGEPVGEIKGGPGRERVQVLRRGLASGPLVGGYLPSLVASLGTEFEVETRGKILFFEDLRKEPFEIDRMLTHLWMAGKLQDTAGIVVGDCVECVPKGRFPSSFTLKEVLRDRLGNLGGPVLSGLCFGHGEHKATIPIGVHAVLDTKKRSLEIVESAVEK